MGAEMSAVAAEPQVRLAHRPPMGWRALLVHLAILLGILVGVWWPEFRFWYVRPNGLSAAAVEAFRGNTDQPALTEVGEMQLRGVAVPLADRLAAAQAVAAGRLELPGFPSTPITLPFASSDLDKGSPTWALMFASLAAADLLIDGYLLSGRDEWFDLATQVIDGFARHEQSRWLDQGMLWNDHATSARIPVLVKFWSIYRTNKRYDPATAKRVLHLVARSALLLSRPDAYAWRTSHGIVSDLALLEIAAAFPSLPEADMARNTAAERLALHLRYWINGEGMTLLHSAGYHSGSLYHLSLVLRLFTLNRLPIAGEWWTRFERANTIEDALRRPDGSLPLFGDTMNLPGVDPPRVTRRLADGSAAMLLPRTTNAVADANLLLPAAGYALWRDSPASNEVSQGSQTVMVWANHSGLGHKLADELSVLIWQRGRTWLTNVGYWPYGAWGRDLAESWTGSNAPHLLDESPASVRTAAPTRVGEDQNVRFVEVQRHGPDNFQARRQLLRLPDVDAWLVVDDGSDATPRKAMTAWTFAPDLTVRRDGSDFDFAVTSSKDGSAMRASFAVDNGAAPTQFSGSREPFYGWVVVEREPQPATALVIERQSKGGWTALALTTRTTDAKTPPTPGVRMRRWQNAENWHAELATQHGQVFIERRTDLLFVTGAMQRQMRLHAPPAAGPAGNDAKAAFADAQSRFVRFAEVVTYRERATYWLLVAFSLQLGAVFAFAHRWPRAAYWAHTLAWLGWCSAGVWVTVIYF